MSRRSLRFVTAGVCAALVGLGMTPALAQTEAARPDFVAAVASALHACNATPEAADCKAMRDELQAFLAPRGERKTGPDAAARRTTLDEVTRSGASIDEASRAGTARGLANGHGPGLQGQTVTQAGQSAVSASATSDTKTASLALTFDPGALPGTLSVTAQAPIGQDASFQNVATLDGLVKSTNVGLQYNIVFPVVGKDASVVLGSDEYRRACNRILNDFTSLYPAAINDPGIHNVAESCAADLLKAAIDAYFKAHPDLSAADTQKVFDGALDKMQSAANDQLEGLFMLTFNGKVGYETHPFYDASTLAKLTAQRTPFQLGAAVTGLRAFAGGQVSGTLGFNYQRSYLDGGVAGQMKTLCPPTGNPFLKCASGYIGPPTLSEKELLSLEVRYIASTSFPFGVAPSATYDARTGAYAFSFPIYLLTDASKALSGGIRYDWTSIKHQSVVGVFVASEFCVVPGVTTCAPKATTSP